VLIVKPISEDVSQQLKKKPSKKQAVAKAMFKTPSSTEKKTTKRKQCEESKSTRDIIPRRSKQCRVNVKTLLEDVAYGKDDDDGDINTGSSFGQRTDIHKPDNSVPCKRNPGRAKKAGRYVNPTTQMANPTQTAIEVRRKTSKLTNHKKIDTVAPSSVKCRDADQVTQSCKSIRYVAFAAGRTRCYRILWAQQRIQKAISRLSRHKASLTNAGRYACRLCLMTGPTFSTPSSFSAHCIRSHRQWTCSLCVQRFASWSALSRHRKIVHNYYGLKEYNTTHPLHSSASNSSLLNELQIELDSTVEQSSTYNKCGWCGERFARRSELLVHRDTFHRRPKTSAETSDSKVRRRVIREWTCSEKGCTERFKVKDQLRDHMANSHPSVIFSCPECRFKTQVELFLRR